MVGAIYHCFNKNIFLLWGLSTCNILTPNKSKVAYSVKSRPNWKFMLALPHHTPFSLLLSHSSPYSVPLMYDMIVRDFGAWGVYILVSGNKKTWNLLPFCFWLGSRAFNILTEEEQRELFISITPLLVLCLCNRSATHRSPSTLAGHGQQVETANLQQQTLVHKQQCHNKAPKHYGIDQ